MREPLSAMLTWSPSRPSTATAGEGKHTFTVALPAPMYWQRRHQQTLVVIGEASIS
jgi:hypothetical protein